MPTQLIRPAPAAARRGTRQHGILDPRRGGASLRKRSAWRLEVTARLNVEVRWEGSPSPTLAMPAELVELAAACRTKTGAAGGAGGAASATDMGC